MSRFLRLSNLIINTHNINTIKSNGSNYTISIKKLNLDGFFIFGSGGINTDYEKFVFCSKKDEKDYIAITSWIDTLDSKGWLYEGNGNSVLECNKYCRKVTFVNNNNKSIGE